MQRSVTATAQKGPIKLEGVTAKQTEQQAQDEAELTTGRILLPRRTWRSGASKVGPAAEAAALMEQIPP